MKDRCWTKKKKKRYLGCRGRETRKCGHWTEVEKTVSEFFRKPVWAAARKKMVRNSSARVDYHGGTPTSSRVLPSRCPLNGAHNPIERAATIAKKKSKFMWQRSRYNIVNGRNGCASSFPKNLQYRTHAAWAGRRRIDERKSREKKHVGEYTAA